MAAFISIRTGPEAGRKYKLDAEHPSHIGRGVGCEILLTDPISSRFHAVVFYEGGQWHVRDNKSRNGTSVNNQKTDHAALGHDTIVRVGSTELQFYEIDEDSFCEGPVTQTIVRDRPLGNPAGKRSADKSVSEIPPVEDVQHSIQAGNLLDLYQLSIQLLGSGQPDEVIDTAARLLCSRTGADLIGFFRVRPGRKLVLDYVANAKSPRGKSSNKSDPAADLITPSRDVAKRVIDEQEAIWVSEDLNAADQPGRGSDAIFIPLLSGEELAGVMLLQRRTGEFDLGGFELAIAASRLLGTALSTSRQTYQANAERRRLVDRNADADELMGTHSAMIRLKERIDRIGRANGCVLIRGESGAGKELVARALHRASPRNDRPMLSVNCAAIPRDLIESQLFGHRKGAFTGADNDHIGWFQQAHSGTLFLDEVGELTLEGQAKLLRILEGHPFLPVGATEEVRVDVRVVAATNRDLAEFVREKKFREDLYYRLSVFELLVPPLRDRGDDIGLLTDHFIEHFSLQHGRPGIRLAEEARKRLLEYHWPGNVRQLRNVIDSAIVMADDDEIQPQDLGLRDAGTGRIDSLALDHWERHLIREALQRTEGSVPEAAKLLGISRATAYRKISEYEIK